MWQAGFSRVVGVDEVGRGALAGPLCVGAVMLSPDQPTIAGVLDSKLLTARRREALSRLIVAHHQVRLGWASVSEIDHLGLTLAWELAIGRAVRELHPEYVLLDGKYSPTHIEDCRFETIIKGDRSVYSIAAASIAAKVARDRLMAHVRLGSEFGWSSNKGYATLKHRQTLKTTPPSPWHRRSFLSPTLHSTTSRGDR